MTATQLSIESSTSQRQNYQRNHSQQAQIDSELGKELFPTPDEVLQMMLEPHIKTLEGVGEFLRGNQIFDPSAGRGDIFEFINKRFPRYRRSYEFLACEIEQDLRYILTEKDIVVIGSDWLEYDEPRMFPFIVMNPPFSEGVTHVLKAWRHLAPDGHLTALLNVESLNNPFTRERQQLCQLIKLYGSHEVLGQVFKHSQRPTDVNVAMIRLHKPKTSTRLEFEGFEYEREQELEFDGFNTNPLAKRDIIKNLVAHYNAAREILLQRHHAQTKLNWSLDGIDRLHGESDKCLELKHDFDKQLKVLKARFWSTVFTRSEIGQQITSNFKRDFNDFQRSQKAMAFTESNIVEVLEMFFFNREDILQKCIVEVFDQLTKHHENCLMGAWKTNSSYKVNQKIIFPYGITYEKDWGFRLSYRHDREVYHDLDKVLKYINGDRDICTVCEAIEQHIQRLRDRNQAIDYRTPFESSYFLIKIFKKGTVHLKFLDVKLWEEFNRRAAIGKQWIGADY